MLQSHLLRQMCHIYRLCVEYMCEHSGLVCIYDCFCYNHVQVQLRQAAVIVNGGIALFAGINLYRGNEKFYEEIAMPLLHFLPPEASHDLGIKLAKYKIVPKPQVPDSPSLVRFMFYVFFFFKTCVI